MKHLRFLLLPLAATIGLIALAICWWLALVNPAQSKRLARWIKAQLPDIGWYFPRNAKSEQK